MRYLLIGLLILFNGAQAAQASCYGSLEAEAEQGIRIHSELMVIGLNCQHMASVKGKNLYAAYREFTSLHQDLITSYEDVLLAYYKRSGDPNPEAQLNLLRTSFANKISQDAANMRPDIFCQKFSPRIAQVENLSRNDMRQWAATIYPSHPVSRPLCASASVGR